MRAIEQIPERNQVAGAFPCLGEDPVIHPTATLRDTRVGSYVEVGPWAELIKVELGDYSYIAGVHTSLFNTAVGKFTSIASSVRINPVAHPMDRPTQHHCTYRRRQYGFDDAIIDKLLASAWWDWPHEKLQREFPRLLDINAFFKENAL